MLLHLIRKTIFNDPLKNCVVRGSRQDWKGLPHTKSLFSANPNCGLPIGNLTSQLFGNVYLNDFDHFVKRTVGIRYYGRYVDDCVLVHQDKAYLKAMIPLIRQYLSDHCRLQLHPDKIYLQHYSKGVQFLGVMIKPYRNYTGNRTKGNFYRTITYWNAIIRANEVLEKEELEAFLASMNSYLGVLRHQRSYKLRKKMLLQILSEEFRKYIYISDDYRKLKKRV